MIWCDAQKKDGCQISLPGFWLYLPYAVLYHQLLFEMSQSVYWIFVLQKECIEFCLNSFSNHSFSNPRCFRGFVLLVLEYCSAIWCSAADTHLRLLDRVVSGASFLLGVCLRMTLHIVDLFQYYVCCIRSGVTRCTLYTVLFLCRMCRWGLHAALW